MKRNKVKGFTLAELIVVMAIFSLVLAAAWSLMGPVGKMMSLADVRESGSANINAIAKYLQVELSSTEYIMPINYIPADEGKAAVNRFVERYYEGVLKSEGDVASELTVTWYFDAQTLAPVAAVYHTVTDSTQKINIYSDEADVGVTNPSGYVSVEIINNAESYYFFDTAA